MSTTISYDGSIPLSEQAGAGHNRWHPGLPPVARVSPGEEVTFETGDATDAQLRRDSEHADVGALELSRSHPLTGPVHIQGAEPGDVLEIELIRIEPADWGYTALIPGSGLLADLFPEPFLVVWEIDGRYARSIQLPGVAVPVDAFPGIIGVAPSLDQLDRIRRREEELSARGGDVVDSSPDTAFPPSCADGLRTIPPREFGGNIDIRQLTVGSRLLLPVSVPGALASIGDVHCAQGDGEVCGTAIEMCAAVTVRFRVESAPVWRSRFPVFRAPARRERASFAVTGLPISDDRNESFDLTLSARSALIQMIDWLTSTRGLSREAAYALCSAAVDLRISEVVNRPNSIVTAFIPLDIFSST
jgi:formamidase